MDDKADPAHAAAEAALKHSKGQAGRVLVAGPASRCSQKIHNLIAGGEHNPVLESLHSQHVTLSFAI